MITELPASLKTCILQAGIKDLIYKIQCSMCFTDLQLQMSNKKRLEFGEVVYNFVNNFVCTSAHASEEF